MIRERSSRRPLPRGAYAGAHAFAVAVLALGGWSLLGASAAPPPSTPPPSARLAESVRSAQKVVEEIRGVPFPGTVASAFLPEKELPKLLEEKLVEDLPTSFEKYASSLVALGLVDPTPELLKKLVGLYARQVAGFYDPSERKFYIVPERSAETAVQVPELGIGAGNLMEEALLTHELTHALQDRRLDLDRRMKALKSSTDAMLALQAFLEGEATVVMMESLVSRLPAEARAGVAGGALTEMMAGLAAGGAGVEGSEGVPEFFVKELLFPYTAGTAWIEKKRASGGWAPIEEAYRRLPASTSEILHPDRPTSARPRLAEADVPKESDLPPGASVLYSDTLGEWTLRTLLERAGDESSAARIAAQHSDDRVIFFAQGEGKDQIGFLWRIRCASPAAAGALAAALAPVYASRPAPARPVVHARGDVVEVERGRPEPKSKS